MPNPSSQFHIQLDGIKLTDAQTKALAAELDKVVSSHLAKVDFRGDLAVGRPLLLNPEWLGIWIRSLKSGKIVNVGTVKDIGQTLVDLPQRLG